MERRPAETTRDMAGEEGTRYRIPVREVPTLEFHRNNRLAGVRTMEEVAELCTRGVVPCTKIEHKWWGDLNSSIGLYYAGWWGVLGLLSSLVARVWVPRAFKRPEVWRSRSVQTALSGCCGGIGALTLDSWDLLYPSHRWLCHALTRKTPLGDAARAIYEREVAKDEGTLSFGAVAGHTSQIMGEGRQWIRDKSNPYSPASWSGHGPTSS
eukprot:Hpha_TRINITY_DN23438_c0_g1::TRINITY_DN23438_c0_g1_i1::g.114001::m.114001